MVFIKLTFPFLFFFITLTSTTSAGVTDANSDYTDLSSHEGNAQGFQFNNDGKKFFVVGKTGDLTQFSLSTAYDVSTASHEGEIDIPGQGTGMTGLAFSGNGMVMFVVNESTDKVHPFTLDEAFNPIAGIASTGTAVSVVSGDNCPTDLQFNNDGSKLYIIGCQGDRVDEYDLTSNYTLNATMSVARTSVNVSDRNPRAVIFSPDGTIMITNGIQDGCLPHQFTLSTPFDVSSAVSNGELGVNILKQLSESSCFDSNTFELLSDFSSSGNVDDDRTACENSVFDYYNPGLGGIFEPAGGFYPEIFASFDLPGEVNTVYIKNSVIFSGMSTSNGCYISLLGDNGGVMDNLSIANSYTINSISEDNGVVALSAGHDGFLLYQWNGGLNMEYIGQVETPYSNHVRVDGNNVIVSTEDGIYIYILK